MCSHTHTHTHTHTHSIHRWVSSNETIMQSLKDYVEPVLRTMAPPGVCKLAPTPLPLLLSPCSSVGERSRGEE